MTSEQVLNASYKRAFHTQRLLAHFTSIYFLFFVRDSNKLVIINWNIPSGRYQLLLHSHDLHGWPIQQGTVLDAYHRQ